MIWTAGFRTGVISPHETIKLTEPFEFADQTVRQVLYLAGGGERIRVRLTNLYGRAPVKIANPRVAAKGVETPLHLDGADEFTIEPGQEVVLDAADVRVAPGAELVLSFYLPEPTGLATYSHRPMETAYVAEGDHVSAPTLPGAKAVEARFFVSGVDVLVPEGTAVAVAFGDSWFEGVGSTTGANRRSVDVLNRRLARGWVVNQGIAGNRLLTDEIGERALARFDRDVLAIPAVTHVLVNFGINDLGLPGMIGEPPATPAALIEGFTSLAERAHDAKLRIIAATIGPFAGVIYPGISTPEGLAARREVNEWIRATDVFDAVFDVARAVENPEDPDFIRPDLDGGDGMHLNDAGAAAMAGAVDLETLVL
ncbi:GDSL-type esterase/lipase family protein [Spirillospora sp. CA-294931]|uniref:GDSL-type esterase/lipase family protein n=1 Tax=Spirillospora sp. CA-294931 TaxID=3240042 RepID=UPI003D92AF10